jgi:hypothetical protein
MEMALNKDDFAAMQAWGDAYKGVPKSVSSRSSHGTLPTVSAKAATRPAWLKSGSSKNSKSFAMAGI